MNIETPGSEVVNTYQELTFLMLAILILVKYPPTSHDVNTSHVDFYVP